MIVRIAPRSATAATSECLKAHHAGNTCFADIRVIALLSQQMSERSCLASWSQYGSRRVTIDTPAFERSDRHRHNADDGDLRAR